MKKTTKRTKKGAAYDPQASTQTPAPETTAPKVVETPAPETVEAVATKETAAVPTPAVSIPTNGNGETKEAPLTKLGEVLVPLGKPRTAILAALAKNGAALSRAAIAEATGIHSGFTSLLGHVDPARREERSLAKLGYIEPVPSADGKSIGWAITTAGVKALAATK
jgi:hypothetical protein